jgi:acyl dehydratase
MIKQDYVKSYKTEITNLIDLKNYLGKELGVSNWVKITQNQINNFANTTEDLQWIHTDPELCKIKSPYKKPIAHGFLILSMAPKFCYETLHISNVIMGVNYGLDKVRFMNPTIVNSYIRARVSLMTYELTEKGVKYKMKLIIEIKNIDKPACIAELIALAY